MKNVRSSLVAFALVVIMSGSALLGIGASSGVSAASIQHVAASSVVNKSTELAIYRPLGWCPIAGMAC